MFGIFKKKERKKSVVDIMKERKEKYDLINAIADRQHVQGYRKLRRSRKKLRKETARFKRYNRGLIPFAFLFLALPFSVFADTTVTSNVPFDDSDGWVTEMRNYTSIAGTYYTVGDDNVLNSVTVPVCLAHYAGYTLNSDEVYMRVMDSVTKDWLYNSDNSINANDMTVTCNWYDNELLPTYGHQWETFTFSNATLETGKTYYIVLNNPDTTPFDNTSSVAVQSGDDVTGNNGTLDHIRVNFSTGVINQLLTGQYAGTLVFTKLDCAEYGAIGIFCPPVKNTATAFAGLFSTAIVFTILNLWPYLLGIIILLIVYKAGRKILRI